MGKWVGIDLGTTNSAVAFAGEKQEVLSSTEQRQLTPSIVALRRKRAADGSTRTELLVGDPAYAYWPLAPTQTIVSVKRLIGRGAGDEEIDRVRRWAKYTIKEPSDGTKESLRVVLGEAEYSPIDISAEILKKLKRDAEHQLADVVTHAVVTVPAYFSQIQREATRQACLAAGMKVIRILDEPTAAAIAFGVDRGESSEPQTVVVFDLGGGTFDVSVLMIAGGVFAPLNLAGDMWLGGDDFDQLIIDHVIQQIRSEHGTDPTGNARFMVELKRASQRAKEQLQAAVSADIILAGMLDGPGGVKIDVECEVTREWFESAAEPLLAKINRVVAEAIRDADLQPADVDHVIMAGSASGLLSVQRAMESMFGADKVSRRIHPKHCVALGAALFAVRIGGIVCPSDEHVNPADATECEECGTPLGPPIAKDPDAPPPIDPPYIAPFPYGIQSEGDVFTIFVEKGDLCPPETPRAVDFFTRFPGDRMINIPVFGGTNRERASANEKQGEAFTILPPGLPKGTPVRIRLWLNRNGSFELTAQLHNGMDLRPWSVPKGEALDRAIQGLEKVEEALRESRAAMRGDQIQQIEREREEVFGEIRGGDLRQAMEHAERLADRAAEPPPPPDLLTRARGIIAWTEHVLREYGWALDPAQATVIERALEALRDALAAGGEAEVADRFRALDTVTDDLPDIVKSLLALRAAVESRVRPLDPARARELSNALDIAIERLRADAAGAVPAAKRAEHRAATEEMLARLINDIMAAISSGGGVEPKLEPCPSCGHPNPEFAYRCSKCANSIPHIARAKATTTADVLRMPNLSGGGW